MKFDLLRIYWLIPFFIWVLAGSLSGNEPEPVAEVAVRAVTWADDGTIAEVYGMEEGAVPPRELELHLWTADGRTEPFLIPFTDLSSPLKIKHSGGKLVFLKQPFNAADGEVMPPVAAQADIAADATDVLVLLVPTDLAAKAFRALAIDNSQSSFLPNTLRVFNLTRDRLGISFNGETRLMEPRGETRFATGGIRKRNEMLVVAREPEEGSRIQYQSHQLRIRANDRITCFLVPMGNSGRIQIFAVSE